MEINIWLALLPFPLGLWMGYSSEMKEWVKRPPVFKDGKDNRNFIEKLADRMEDDPRFDRKFNLILMTLFLIFFLSQGISTFGTEKFGYQNICIPSFSIGWFSGYLFALRKKGTNPS